MNKSIMISVMLLIATQFAVQAEQNFDIRCFSCSFTIQPKSVDGDMQAFTSLDNSFRSLIDQTRANQTANLLQIFLSFLTELKDAVASGFNLYTSVQTQQETLSEVVEEMVVQEIINVETTSTTGAEAVATVDNEVNTSTTTEAATSAIDSTNSTDVVLTDSTPVAQNKLTILIDCSCSDESGVAQYETLKSTMQAFENDMNNQNMSTLVTTMADVYQQVSVMKDASIRLFAE